MYAVYVRSWNKSIYRRCSYETAYQRIVLTCIRVKDKGARANTAYTWYTRSPGGKSYDEITRVYPGSHRAKEKASSSTSISSNKYLPPLETILFEKFRSFEFPFNSVRKFSGNLERERIVRISRFGECFCCDAWKFLQRVNGSKLQPKG